MRKILAFATLCWLVCACTCPEETTQLRVATYNLRMDTAYDSINAWPNRKEKVKALIRYHDFDIVGTQEGFLHQLTDLCEIPGYAYSGAGRDDGEKAGEHSAILYKQETFELLEAGNYWLSETPDKPSLGWDATCCNRICSWVKFRHKVTGREFYFFNVHFDHQGVIARKESGKLMVQKIKEIAGDTPVICTGDFNSSPETEQIGTLSTFLHDARTITLTPPYGPEGTFNGRFTNPITSPRIDYIFVSDPFQVDTYAALTDNDGRYYPSDHLPVVAEIQIK
ncbi:MAG: endonuclease/exonuclease/phosphatase family protein [Tannerellaceae bacterium]|jgi:endonuclease/exonuclease/phosphatase family metal-dependent hydrolase|nr:endonuclease/exonuclease/phosphatase family protein [Tannerellaceae bacterium]